MYSPIFAGQKARWLVADRRAGFLIVCVFQRTVLGPPYELALLSDRATSPGSTSHRSCDGHRAWPGVIATQAGHTSKCRTVLGPAARILSVVVRRGSGTRATRLDGTALGATSCFTLPDVRPPPPRLNSPNSTTTANPTHTHTHRSSVVRIEMSARGSSPQI